MNTPITTLISLAKKGATISIDSSEYSIMSLVSLHNAVKEGKGHLIIRNASSKSVVSLQSIADSNVTFVF